MRPAAILLLSAATSCQSLFGGYGMDNPDNCVLNAQLCVAPNDACNTVTKLCEPAIQLTSVTPPRASNQGGDTLTLHGHRLTSNLIVRIAGMNANVTGATQGDSEDQLTVVLPANPTAKGKVLIELEHPEGQKQQRDDLFSYYSQISFSETLISGPSDPRGIWGGDFNGDGKKDVALCDNSSNQIYFYPGNGDGTFGDAVTTALDVTPQYCAIGDVNGDGQSDIVVSSQSMKQFQISLGSSSGTFAKQTAIAAQDFVTEVALADLNRDGKDDFLASATNKLSVQLGDGSGGFGTPTYYPLFTNGASITMSFADMNGDGNRDLLAGNGNDPYLSISFGDGQGGFTKPATQIVLSKQPRRPIAADLNGDKVPDIITGLGIATQFALILGRSDGSFETPQLFTLPSPILNLGAADFNVDGAIDLAWVSNYATKNFGTFIGLNDGSLVSPLVRSEGLGPAGFSIQDLNGDGKPDIVIPEHVAHQLRILLNTSL